MAKALLTVALFLAGIATMRAQLYNTELPHHGSFSNLTETISVDTNPPIHYAIYATNFSANFYTSFVLSNRPYVTEAIFYDTNSSGGNYIWALVPATHIEMNGNTTIDSFEPASVPEPNSGVLLAAGVASFAFLKRRRITAPR